MPCTALRLATSETMRPAQRPVSGCRPACQDRPLEKLLARLAAIAELEAAGFSVSLDGAGKRLSLYRGDVARGYWSDTGEVLIWSSASQSGPRLSVDTCCEAARCTMAMVLVALSTKRKRASA